MKKHCKIGLNLLSLFMLCSCEMMVERRTFQSQMERQDSDLFVPGHDFEVAKGDTGKVHRSDADILARTPAEFSNKSEELHGMSLFRELADLEDDLGEDEEVHYHRQLEYLTTVSDRIYYLRLDPKSRGDFISSLKEHEQEYNIGQNVETGFQNVSNDGFNANSSLSDTGMWLSRGPEITQGMSMNEVLEIWGRPNDIEVAGNPDLRNERWTFNLNGEKRYIFFENGSVDGWDLD